MIRQSVADFVSLGPLPSEDEATADGLVHLEKAYRGIERPVSDSEARLLCQCFGPDDCFGLTSSLLHLIETAPGWPLTDCLNTLETEGVRELRQRARRSGLM